MRPILSICVPTYNAVKLLQHTLPELLQQSGALSDLVEILVSDDGSSDGTSDYLAGLPSRPGLKIFHNAKNLGAMGNFHSLLHLKAQGEFVWLLGQDDLLAPHALRHLVDTLNRHPGTDLFYANYRFQIGEDVEFLVSQEADRPVNKWQDLIQDSGYLGTGAFVHIIRRQWWNDYWNLNPPEPDHTSLKATYPHCVMIADRGLHHPAYLIARPLLHLTAGTATWGRTRFQVYSEHTPACLFYFREKGLAEAAYHYNAKWVFDMASWVLREKLNEKGTSAKKILAPFLKKYGREPRAWKAALKAYAHSERHTELRKIGKIWRAAKQRFL